MRFRTLYWDRERMKRARAADIWDMSYDKACRLASNRDHHRNPKEEIRSAIDEIRYSSLTDRCEPQQHVPMHGNSSDGHLKDWEQQQEIERRKRLDEMQQQRYQDDYRLLGP